MKILVVLEHDQEQLRPGSLSAIGFASDLALQSGGEVLSLLLGDSLDLLAREAAQFVPVITASSPLLADPLADRHAHVIAEVTGNQQVDLVVAASSTYSRDVVSRAGGLLGGAMASDIVDHAWADGRLVMKRPMYAGAILASRLSEDPQRSVLLLEAGPDYPDLEQLPDELKYGYETGGEEPSLRTPGGHPIALANSKHNWQYVAKATDKAPPLPVPRGKVTGGSSAINFSAFFRGIPEDFDNWVLMGNNEWAFEKVLPYFRKLETDVDQHGDYHGSEGPIIVHHANKENWPPAQVAFYNACRAEGFADCVDHNSPGSTGVGPSITNNHNRVRFSTALGYLSESRHRLNLTIKSNCFAHKIIFECKKATGVLVESAGEYFAVEGEQIILSAGAIGSPQLLMLSGIGPAHHLSELGVRVVQDLPGVGNHLKDHPKVYTTWRISDEYLSNPKRAQRGVALRCSAPGSHLPNDLNITLGAFVSPRANPLDSHGTAQNGELSAEQRIEMMIALLLPESTGSLRLASADPSV